MEIGFKGENIGLCHKRVLMEKGYVYYKYRKR